METELNDEQLAAVQTQARHALVIAGAGSGKTRTLTHRVAWLLTQGVPGWRILLLTFTNKASREMLSRVESLVGQAEAAGIWGGTFHSVANRILRRYGELLGYARGFSILDSDDQRALLRALVKEHTKGLPLRGGSAFPKAETINALHSLSANTNTTWQSTLKSDYPHLERYEEELGRIYADYKARKMAANAMDFDDLLLNTVRLLEEHALVRRDLQERFLHVLVDEYQDTNALQERMISLLCGGERTGLMVVGDDAQSIYSWRGASVEHIIGFPQRYPDAEVYKIETNYRSVPAILEISNAAIARNERQFAKTLRPARHAGREGRPVVLMAPDNRMEALAIARRVDELMERGIPGKDIAILYRAHFHSLDVQMELARARIPYRVTSGVRFFEQAHVKDAVAYLRLVSNPRDEVAFLRLARALPRVGEASAAKMWQQWLAALGGADATADDTSPWSERMRSVAAPKPALTEWRGVLSTLDALRPEPGQPAPRPAQMVHTVCAAIEPHIRQNYENFEQRMEDLYQLETSLEGCETLEDFLSQVALLSETDRDAQANDDDCVTLSTIHQAKGLEWRVVFLIFLADGMFPHYRVLNNGDPREMEEETRLFYVALTRAEDQLYLSYPRYNGHGYDRSAMPPSRFLTALPSELYELE